MGVAGRHWTKDQERQWRSTFTRGNMEGAKKLHYELRTKGAEAVAKAEKDRALKKMEAGVRGQVGGIFNDIAERMMSEDRIMVGGPDGSGFPVGVFERTFYYNNHKVIQHFDGNGNLTGEEKVEF